MYHGGLRSYLEFRIASAPMTRWQLRQLSSCFGQGDGNTAAELGRLKSKFEVLEKISMEKNCTTRFQQKSTKS
jgi:hypothetical protein